MTFTKESGFKNARIEILSHKGWEKDVIKYPQKRICRPTGRPFGMTIRGTTNVTHVRTSVTHV